MSPDEFALMQAIRANPPDNTPRLVYADYLEERGDESNIARAEFIRVQCVLAKGNFEADEREQYRNRESQLLDSYGERWVQQLRAAIHKLEPKYGPAIFSRLKVRSYDRGMIASATILSRLFAVFPDIQHLVGPIQHLEVVDARGMPPLKRSADGNRKWDLKCLKVLSLQEFPDDGNNRVPRLTSR